MTSPSSPAGGGNSSAASPTQAAALHPPSAVPAGEHNETDLGWQARDGHDSYILALQVANGKVPHPGRKVPT